MIRKNINKILYIYLFILNIIYISLLYIGRIIFISLMNGQEKFADLWENISMVRWYTDLLLMWSFAVITIFIIFEYIIKKISVKEIKTYLILLLSMLIISIVPYFIMKVFYEEEHIYKLYINAFLPMLLGIGNGLFYGAPIFLVTFIYKKLSKK